MPEIPHSFGMARIQQVVVVVIVVVVVVYKKREILFWNFVAEMLVTKYAAYFFFADSKIPQVSAQLSFKIQLGT